MCIAHNLKKRYLSATLEYKNEKQKALVEALAKEECDLIVVGTVGTGKTHLVSAYIRELVDKNIYAKYITEYEFADLFSLKASSDADTQKEALNSIYHCKNYRVLVIDDVGKRELTKKQNIELDELISARYDNMLRTIIVSNLTPAEIKDRIKDRAYDRLKGNNAKVIVFDGKSMRGDL